MARKKPFSNKQKKAQLQLKRQTKKQDREKEEKLEKARRYPGEDSIYESKPIVVDDDVDNLPQVIFKGEKPEKAKKKEDPKRSKKGKGGRIHPAVQRLPANLRSIFEPESGVIIAERKRNAQLPILRGHEQENRILDTNQYSTVIDLPKRPAWDSHMSTEQIEESEAIYFEQWLAEVYKYEKSRLNFFEHNLQVWRQLWRVCEMSDVLVLVADIRHPLFHFPPSLYQYITVYHNKPLMLLLNKIDLVTEERVEMWVEYFKKSYPNLHVIPFSTHTELKHVHDEFTVKHKRLKKGKLSHRYLGARGGAGLIKAICDLAFPDDPLTQEEMDSFEYKPPPLPVDEEEEGGGYQGAPQRKSRRPPYESEDEDDDDDDGDDDDDVEELIVDPEEIEKDSKSAAKRKERTYRVIGMVGHPNVGKSSLINGMKRKKVVSTSRTPGHTKHFQTIFLTSKICLCDCPGLVFPALDMKKELQILCGLFPIAQAREPYSSIRYLAERVRIEEIYKLDPPPDDQGVYNRKNYAWNGWNIAQCQAIKRGYRSKGGREDAYRAGLEILKDTLDGVIVLAFDPPRNPELEPTLLKGSGDNVEEESEEVAVEEEEEEETD